MSDALPDLEPMMAEMDRYGGVLCPSKFWEEFSDLNRRTLLWQDNIDSFKRSVNHNYFQWVVTNPLHSDFRAVLRRFARRPNLTPLRAHVEDLEIEWFDDEREGELPKRLRPRGYAVYVACLWELVRRWVGDDVLDRLQEPELGRPMIVRHRGRAITQDLANGALEYAAVAKYVPADRLAAPRILEIGGGYGRLMWMWLTLHPDAKGIMVDIPPALALSQRYLTRLFPERSVARFRPDADLDELHAEVMRSDLAFLTPNQFEQLAPLQADIALNVSSLHEMTPEQVARYLDLLDRHAAGGFFYTKQWRLWENTVDNVVADREKYPYPARWRRVYDRVHPVQVRFFEALFAL